MYSLIHVDRKSTGATYVIHTEQNINFLTEYKCTGSSVMYLFRILKTCKAKYLYTGGTSYINLVF